MALKKVPRWLLYEQVRGNGRPSTANPYSPSSLTPKPHLDLWATKDDVVSAKRDERVCTLKCLGARGLNGGVARYGRAGDIADSHNVYYDSLIDPANDVFLPL